MYDIMEENMAGKYEVIRNERGSVKPEDRLYYRTYIPASLTSIDYNQFVSSELSSRLMAVYKGIGVLQGLAFHESNFIIIAHVETRWMILIYVRGIHMMTKRKKLSLIIQKQLRQQ